MAEMDFPASPVIGQTYTTPSGIVYEWNGVAWVVGFYAADGYFTTAGDILTQIRVLLQDTDASNYRYSDDSIIANINMGLLEMFRLRPDIFLTVDFQVPFFNTGGLDATWPVEQQWVPPIVYYATGLTQLRDDEGTQDQRAASFKQIFTAQLMTLGA